MGFWWDFLLVLCPPHLGRGAARMGGGRSWQTAGDGLFSSAAPPCRVTGSQASRGPEEVRSPSKHSRGYCSFIYKLHVLSTLQNLKL